MGREREEKERTGGRKGERERRGVMMIMMVLVMMMNDHLRDSNVETELLPRKRRTAKAHVRYVVADQADVRKIRSLPRSRRALAWRTVAFLSGVQEHDVSARVRERDGNARFD